MANPSPEWEQHEWGRAYQFAVSQPDSTELLLRVEAARKAIRVRLEELASSRPKTRVEELAALYEASTMLEVLQVDRERKSMVGRENVVKLLGSQQATRGR